MGGTELRDRCQPTPGYSFPSIYLFEIHSVDFVDNH